MSIADEIKKVGTPVKGRIIEQQALEIPFYVEEGTILHGLHQGVISGGNKSTTEFSVTCGAGLGSDHVSLSWKEGDEEHVAVLYLRDVLKAWVGTFDEAAAKALPSVNVTIENDCASCGKSKNIEEMNMSPSRNSLVCELCFDQEMEEH